MFEHAKEYQDDIVAAKDAEIERLRSILNWFGVADCDACVIAKQQKEIERLKQIIEDVHNLRYPGLAIKESTLLDKIYKLTIQQ